MNKTVFRLVLAVLAIALLAIPALAQDGDPKLVDIDISPAAVEVGESVEATVYIGATVFNLDTEEDVYLSFQKDETGDPVPIQLVNEEGVWMAELAVDVDDVGEWKMVGCYYLAEDDEEIDIAYDEEDPDLALSFTVQEQETDPGEDEDEDLDEDEGEDETADIEKGLLAPKQLRASVEYDDEGKTTGVKLSWKYFSSAAPSEFTVLAGYNAGKMQAIGMETETDAADDTGDEDASGDTTEDEDSDATTEEEDGTESSDGDVADDATETETESSTVSETYTEMSCTVSIDQINEALNSGFWNLKAKKHVLFRIVNEAGKSNVAVVSLATLAAPVEVAPIAVQKAPQKLEIKAKQGKAAITTEKLQKKAPGQLKKAAPTPTDVENEGEEALFTEEWNGQGPPPWAKGGKK